MEWLGELAIVSMMGTTFWFWMTSAEWRTCAKRRGELIDGMIAELDKQQSKRNAINHKLDEIAQQVGELQAIRDRNQAEVDGLMLENAEQKRIIDDYRRWMRESVKLMPDSVKHVSDIQLVERHRPRPAEVKS